MQKTTRFSLAYAIVALLGVMVIQDLLAGYGSVATLPYSEFQKLVREDKVKEVVITDHEIRGELKAPGPSGKTLFKTTRVDNVLADELAKHNVKLSGHVESKMFATVLSWILPVVVFFGIWMLIMRRVSGGMGAGGGLMSIG